MIARVFAICLSLAVSAPLLRAQAAVEYAAKSALSESNGGIRFGTCVVGSTLFRCLQRSYPEAFYGGIAGLLLVGLLLYSRRRA